jgi:hypothetical protein
MFASGRARRSATDPKATFDLQICAVDSAGETPYGFDFGKHSNLFVAEAAGGATNASAASSNHLTRGGELTLIDGKVPTQLTAACRLAVTP